MSPPLEATLRHFAVISKEKHTGPVVCSWCNGVSHIKHGSYRRYAVGSTEMIPIQRYYCKHDQCRRTFSILPHPFLRISRSTLCLLQALLGLYEQQVPVDHIAKTLKVSWNTVARAIEKAGIILPWLHREAESDASWAPTPCMNPPAHWPSFIRMFSAKFYPKRYGNPGPTQYAYC